MNRNLFKSLAIVVLFFFSWTFAGIFNFAYAIDNLPGTVHGHGHRSEERFQKAIEEIGEILEDPVTDRETKASKAKSKRVEIEDLDKEIRKQFAETEKRLREAGLPQEILQRHDKFVKHYEDNLNELKANLDSIEKTKGLSVEVEIEKTRNHLQRVKPPKRHIPLDPNKLPHRTPKVEKREPRLKKEDFERDFPNPKKAQAQKKPILVASIGPLKGLLSSDSDSSSSDLLAQTSNQPTPSDLSENIEVQFTPEIRAKAQELGHNPVKIYNWVRNNIEFVPTYGSIQGAHMTLLTKQGNAFDTASLLIALLRASNIPARYVYGTIQLPIDKVMNWVGGFTDPKSAVDFIASGGIPGVALISGGRIVAVRMEHVWVEAWVDYVPSSGARHKTGQGDTWIPLDASFKQYTYKMGMDLYSSLSFDGDQFLNNYITDVQNITPYQHYGLEMFRWLDVNVPNATIEDILGAEEISLSKIIKDQNFPFLLGTLPYRVIVVGAKYSQIPDTLRHKVSLNISGDTYGGDGITLTKNLAELSGKRITLSYIPATAYDEALVKQYGGNLLNVPPYLLKVKPVVKIDGIDSALGASVGMGSMQLLTLSFYDPRRGMDIVQNTILAGTYSAITIQSLKTPVEIVTSRMERLRNNSKNIGAVTLDDLLGELLYNIGLSYFHNITFENDLYAKTFQVVYMKEASEAITTLNVDVSYLFGIPRSVRQGGLNIDVDRDISIPVSITGDMNRIKQFMIISGMTSSAWEHRIFESFFNTPSVSAMKLLKYANQQGVPIYSIDSTNIGQLLPAIQVSSEIKMEIQNAVNAGKRVIIPQTELQYYEWNGIGYAILDPLTGAGAYRISGGLDGGGTAKILTNPPITMSKDSLEYQRLKEVFLNVVVENAKSLIGTPFIYGGKDPSLGLDCSGLTKYVYGNAGFTIPGGAAYQYNYFRNNGMLFQTPQAGDLFFWKNRDGNIYHTGIVVDISQDNIGVIDAGGATDPITQQRVVGKRTFPINGNFWQTNIAGYGRPIE